jgi:hypothetical protein
MDHNGNPARIRSIEWTASSTGPQRITTATQLGANCSIDAKYKSLREDALLYSSLLYSSLFRILSAESRNVCGRVLGLIETNPRIQTATRPAADHNCNPARGACLVRVWCVFGSCNLAPWITNAIRPAVDHNGNPARYALHDVPRLRNRWRYVARCTAIAKPVAVCCTMYRDCKTGGGMLHDVPARSGSQLQPGSGCVFGACNLAPWITTSNRPGARCTMYRDCETGGNVCNHLPAAVPIA